ncbi:MAG: SRPBCC domain-containing protein, partial [Acidiferrobacterales bacterium]|nr:SRPBCC domain-containing protein [Acidiferrobacterales bacterium]
MTDRIIPDEIVEVRQLVDASIETVFEAWTEPEHVKRWWSPNATTTCTLCEIDLRVGGHYRLEMYDTADENTCKVHGQFQEISPPTRLVYTWNGATHQGKVTNTLVTVEF